MQGCCEEGAIRAEARRCSLRHWRPVTLPTLDATITEINKLLDFGNDHYVLEALVLIDWALVAAVQSRVVRGYRMR